MSARKKLTGHGTMAVPNPVQRVTEKEMSNYVRLSKYFKQAQYSKSSHPGLIEKLLKLYNKLPPKEFLAAFQTCLRVPFLRLEKDPAVSRTMEFAASFCTQLNVQEDTTGEGDLCRFVQKMFKYLLENSPADISAVRFRICQLVSLILSGLGEGMALEGDMAEDITEAMLKRVRDKVPAIRAQALLALERLQDPDDLHCKVTQAFKFHIEHDPSYLVRGQALKSIAKTQSTLTCLYARHLDASEKVRLTCVLVMSRINIRSFSIAYRSTLLHQWLKDPAASVRRQAETVLLPAWFNCVNKDYVMLLHCLDLYTENGVNSCQLVIDTLFKEETSEDLVAAVAPLLQNKTVTLSPGVEMCVAKAFLWRCVVRHLREQGDEEQLDAVLPELTPFCAYLRQTLQETSWATKADQAEHSDLTFVMLQLLGIAKGYDFADEMGRTSLYSLVLELLANPAIELSAIHDLMTLFAALEPNVDSRLQRLAELVSDIHAPLDSSSSSQPQPISEKDRKDLTMQRARLRLKSMEAATNQEEAITKGDFLLAQALAEELAELGAEVLQIDERLSTVDKEVTRKETSEPEVLVRCLHVVTEMMRSADVKVLTPHLRSLMQDFVGRIYETAADREVRKLCLHCFACFCLLDIELAREKMPVFYLQLADGEENSPVGVMALSAIFDLYFYYGLQPFAIKDDIDLHYDRIVGKINKNIPEAVVILDSSDSDPSSSRSSGEGNYKYTVLHTLYNIFDDKACPLLHPAAALGFCKLLLSGRVNSYRLLARLLLLWYNPDLDKPTQEVLMCFFRGYTCNREEGLALMVQAFLPVAEAIVSAPHDNPLASVNLDNVLSLIASLIKLGYNPHVQQNYHNNLALVILNYLLSEPDSDLVVSLTRALTALKITVESVPQLDTMLDLTDRYIKKVSYDKVALRLVTKFYVTLRQLTPDNDSDTSVKSKTVDQSVMTVSEANATRCTDQLETIIEDSPASSSPLERTNLPRVPVVVSESDTESDTQPE